MNILAIETSCDDTCVAVVEAKGRKNPHFRILSNIVSSQVKIHRKWGGVYPTLAKREHQRNLAPVLEKSLEEARLLNSKVKIQNSKLQFKIRNLNLSKTLSKKIDFIAVTVGPGLEPCLWVGVNFAKELAQKLNLPIIPVNHIEAHISANFIGGNSKSETRNSKNLFPALCLVVSGGHTQLILMTNTSKSHSRFGDHISYKILGETRDDAAGECFDKVARILGLGYPGGPAIAAEAAKFKVQSSKFKVSLPRPMIYQKNYDFSFSGLKTAVLYDFKSRAKKIQKSKVYKREMAKEVQQAIIDVLIEKTIKAAKDFGAKTIILGGGVAANDELRRQFREAIKKQIPNTLYLIPKTSFCTDNAVMVAVTAYFHYSEDKTPWQKVEAKANQHI